MSDAIRDFLLYCEARNLSSETLRFYREKLSALFAFLGEADLATLTAKDLRGFVHHLFKERRRWDYTGRDYGPVSAGHVNCHIRAMRALFSFLATDEVIPDNPARRVPFLRQPQVLMQTFTQEQLRAMLGACEPGSFTGARNIALLQALIPTGCSHKRDHQPAAH
jgi:integrase/recombinase XerD